MKRSAVRTWLRQFGFARDWNARLGCWQTRREYESLCRRYGSPSILSDPASVRALGEKLWAERKPAGELAGRGRPRILFVGTDWEQDRSGIIPALERLGDLTLFEHAPGSYGQRWIETWAESDAVRKHNGRRLRDYLAGPETMLVIGQMWGFTMDWRAVAAARDAGHPVVNIAMDDRHSFRGRRLGDDTPGGTLGLAPHLSLACTDAPECLSWYRAEGCPAVYMPEASDPEVFRRGTAPKLHDVVFVGSAYGVRAGLVGALERAGIRVAARGTGWPAGPVPTEEMAELFASSRIVLGCGTVGHCPDFLTLKLRDFDAPMSGSLYLTHDNPDLHALFEVGREIETFRDEHELVSKVKRLLADDAAREQVAHAGWQRALADHTWLQRFSAILPSLLC